ncbi:MAG: ribosome maturation factor RimM [Lachnospiraceae bacterium]|nr:ribosome maturation factor RimM [Lachnospiraceae bacterium]
MENLLQVGAILDTHGLRGEVKVFPTTDDPSRYDDLEEVELLTKEGNYLHLEIERVRYFKNLVIVKFKNYDHINDIEQYKKCNLYVTRENAVELEADEYFVADLIGLTAKTDEGEELGQIKDVLTTGANDVYVIDTKEGELLVPAIHDCVQEVDLEAGVMTLHLLPGLRDLNKK